MKTRKILAAVFAFLMVFPTVVSCGKQDGAVSSGNSDGAQITDVSVTEAETEAPSPFELLPASDFGDYEFHVLLNNQDMRQVDLMTEDEETGDLLNDLIFRRNRMIEEKYNIRFAAADMLYDELGSYVRKQVRSDMHDCDLYYSNCYASELVQEGMVYSLSDMPNLRLSEPWWDQAAISGMSVGGKTYMATGDISPTALLTTSCLVFNKELFKSHSMEYPYDIAMDGMWTIDNLSSLTKDVTEDLNGDGKYVLGDDLFCISSWFCDSPYSLFYGSGGTLSKKDENDMPIID